MLLLLWIFALLMLAVWSLTAWGLHKLLSADSGWIDHLGALIEKIPFADRIERWIPGWQRLMRSALDVTQDALAWAGDWMLLAVWVTYGVGTLCLLVAAIGLTLLVVSLREKPLHVAQSHQ